MGPLAAAVTSQHVRDKERMCCLRHLCPADSLVKGLVAPGGIRFASPSLAERQCLQFLADKYKLQPEFVHFKCVWLLHIAVAITGIAPARVPIHGPSDAAG
eukprot:1654681-Pyramimonas_sp.AAC.1